MKIDRAMHKTIFLSFLFACTWGISQAQSGQGDLAYHFTVRGAEDTVIYLANYYGEKLFYADTARSNHKGEFAFKKVKPENEGKFAVVIPGPRYFEVILADGEAVRIETDTTDLVANLKVIESKNNEIMYGYVDYLSERRKVRERLMSDLEKNEGKPKVTAKLKEEFNQLNDEVVAYQKNLVKQYPEKLAAKEIRMSIDVEVPKELHEDRQKGYYWYKKHYFDHVDLKDDRMVRIPIFHTKFINYLKQTVIQDPDTLIAAVDALIAKTDPGSELFKYIVHYSTYHFETSKIMGMDKVFVHMVDTYYTPELATWMADDKLKNIQEKAASKRNTLIGVRMPELILMDTAGTWVSSHRDLNNKYTLIYFYDPDCGHCKKETPKLVEFYNSYEGDIGIFAVSGSNEKKWKKFVKKNEMNFHNVSIPQRAYEDPDYATDLLVKRKTNYHSLKYQEHFDVYSTPKIILLDENKVVKAKDIGVEQLSDILERLEGKAPQAGQEP